MGVCNHLMGNRTEKKPPESAQSPGTNHQHVGRFGLFTQHPSGATGGNHGGEVDPIWYGHSSQHIGNHLGRASLQLRIAWQGDNRRERNNF